MGEACSIAEKEVEDLLSSVTVWEGREIFYRPTFGGFSNSTWRIRLSDERRTFFLKIPGSGIENFVDRAASLEASMRAHSLGIGPRPYDYLSDRGVEIFDFVDPARPCTLREFRSPDIRNRTIDRFRAFNDGGALQLTKTVFDMVEEHVALLEQLGGTFPNDFQFLHNQYQCARLALEASGLDIVPCHNDLGSANFLIDDAGIITMVDFEYASNNDRCHDLAIWCTEVFLDDNEENEAIEHYFGNVHPTIKSRIFVHRVLGDLKWSLWALIQMKTSTIDFDFSKAAMWKLTRLRSALGSAQWSQVLDSL